MKITIYLKSVLLKSSIILLGIAILLTTASHAGDEPVQDLVGPLFTDPEQFQDMPESWVNKPLQYDPAYADADIAVTLDGQLYHAWEPLIQKYAKKNNLKIAVTHGTCGLSAGNLIRKSTDIGAFCCPPGKTDRLPGLQFHTLGIAAVALLVHPDNPVDNVTLDQAREIFMGKKYRWSEILTSESNTNFNHRIQPIGRLHCKLRPGHWRLLLDNEDLFSPSLFEVGAIPDMISQISINPGAIGYEILWMSSYYREKNDLKFLKINGYSPDNPSDVISTNYPLYRVYSFTTWEDKYISNPAANKLVDYLMQQVDNLDIKYSFIPVSRLRQAGWKFKGNELTGEPG